MTENGCVTLAQCAVLEAVGSTERAYRLRDDDPRERRILLALQKEIGELYF